MPIPFIALMFLQVTAVPPMQTTMTTKHTNTATHARPVSMASPYLALDHWAYPAFDRLAAAGAMHGAIAGLRPWTRMECARLLVEVGKRQDAGLLDDDSMQLYTALRAEFASELRYLEGASRGGASLDSVYLRIDGIAGQTINDGFHFAQTETNNFGRPYGHGVNLYTGVEMHAESHYFAASARAEVQRAGTGFVTPDSARTAIANADFTPDAQTGQASGVARVRLLDAYVSFAFRNNQFSFGQQSMWWGPSQGGPLLWSDNAEPIPMLRYDRTRPVKLPLLGEVRGQFFVGRLNGQQYVHTNVGTMGQPGVSYANQPFIHGQKVSFKPTENFEFSVSRTMIFGGPGSPVTFSNFWRSLVSTSTAAGQTDPGDRRSGFDVSYRVPGLRNWLTVYADTFTDDQPFPLAYPTNSAWSPGIHLAKLPRLPKLELRAEGFVTPPRTYFPGFYYFNVRYLSGYTNNRQLIGSWIGREGNGAELWATWWFSPRASLQGSYRDVSVNRVFLSGGGLHDVALSSTLPLSRNWSFHMLGQYERWNFPLLSTKTNSNTTASFQLTWTPAGGRP
jgi:hypothetical protein